MNKYLNLFDFSQKIDYRTEVLSGITVAGKKVHLKHLSADCRQLLKNAEAIIDVNVMEDPTYKVLTDKF